MKQHDVYSYGMVSSSTLYGLRGAFPAPESYAEIEYVRHMTGGEAANSSVVLSRLGAHVKLDGNWLGADDAGRRTREILSEYQVDTSRLRLKEGYEGVQEVVFAGQGTRTIFGTYGRLLKQREWNAPQDLDITRAKVVCLDPFFKEPARRISQLAFDAGVPVVTVDCPYDDPLLEHTSAVVIAESYINENYPTHDMEGLFREYRSATAGLVIFTFGDAPAWYGSADDTIKYRQPFPVNPVDTTGGGDSFRAGIVFGFLQGWSEDKMLEFAAAVAAINCTRFPGVLDSPTCEEVLQFIEAQKTS